ncbi:phage tail protein [Pectobacterium brasiliense]|uniref:phage tail protein n=1 Tax=Pectobacterium brasiliense TaxID=180957 RepID=UPI003985BFC8
MSKYFALLTNIGAAKLANATALGNRLNITRMAVGDGGGVLPTPNPAQTTLINEKRRAALNTLSVDPKNPSQIIAEQVIPENEGGFWIREIGLFDDDGNLIAIANCPETYKPQLQEGSGRIQTVRMILIVSSTDAVTLKIDPAVVLATRDYVDNALTEHEKNRKHPDGTLTAKGFVQLSNATNSDSETLAATPKAVKAANDNASGRVPSGRKINGKALTADITLSAGDVGAYTKLETDTAVSVVAAAANNAATAAASANTNANGRVPSGRAVNGKALSADIVLGAGDVGAYTKAETDTRVAAATTAANNAATAAANANTNANGRVPSGRTVNGKALSADITLGAGDVGAYTKAETDTRVAAATTAANNAATEAANANTNANGRVPSGRTVNGKALSADIALNAGDVGAYSVGESDTKFAPKDSPFLTGSPRAPLAAQSNGSTLIANTQFVQRELRAGVAVAERFATARKINGVPFDGTSDITLTPENLGFGKLQLTPVALLQFSSHLMQSLNFTAINNDTLEVAFEIKSHGRFVEVGKTLLFLLENNAAAISGKSTSRHNPVGKFVVTSMIFPAGNNTNATIRIRYQNHGIQIGSIKTFRVAGFIYREIGCSWMGHISTSGASFHTNYMTLQTPLSSPNMPVISAASTSAYEFEDTMGMVTSMHGGQPVTIAAEMMGNAAVLFATSDTDNPGIVVTDMATIIVYDIVSYL